MTSKANIFYSLLTGSIALLSSACGGYLCEPYYEEGFEAGIASEVKRSYWESKQAEQDYLPVAREYLPYATDIPAYTADDGVLIEAHSQQFDYFEPSYK